jgi:hypothetical protein
MKKLFEDLINQFKYEFGLFEDFPRIMGEFFIKYYLKPISSCILSK